MEVYALDSLFRRIEVVDRFESCIWTERWADIGEFELHVQSTQGNRKLFKTGTRLAINESKRVMTVETAESASDDEGRRMLKVKGRSLEAVLDERLAIGTYAGYNPLAEWMIQDIPEWIARTMVEQILVGGNLHPSDVIPELYWDPKSHPDDPTPSPGSDNLFPEDTIPESNFEIIWYQKPASLYKAVKDIADIYDFGFRLYRNGDTGQLFFNIYTGSDRTLQQETLTPVVFSADLQNLMNTTEFNTTEKTKNVAYVLWEHPDTHTLYREVVYAPEVDPNNMTGFDRHVIYVTGEVSDDDKGDDALISAALQRQGLDELAQHRAFTGFDGEISQYAQYKYDQDYFLGDMVVMQDESGFRNNMRVTEQIFVSDRDGDRAYPTLSFRTFIQPGSWEDFGYRAWEDLGLTEYWADQS
jgi:hypothetical protein